MSLSSYLRILGNHRSESKASFTLLSAVYVPFSLLGLFREFRQRPFTQVGGLVVGQSLQLDNMKMLLLGDMDLGYSSVARLGSSTLTWV